MVAFRKKLARRLLFDKSANDDHERSILSKLKQQCGQQFTVKMEGMVSLKLFKLVADMLNSTFFGWLIREKLNAVSLPPG